MRDKPRLLKKEYFLDVLEQKASFPEQMERWKVGDGALPPHPPSRPTPHIIPTCSFSLFRTLISVSPHLKSTTSLLIFHFPLPSPFNLRFEPPPPPPSVRQCSSPTCVTQFPRSPPHPRYSDCAPHPSQLERYFIFLAQINDYGAETSTVFFSLSLTRAFSLFSEIISDLQDVQRFTCYQSTSIIFDCYC